MSVAVLVAVTHHDESALVTALGAAPGITLSRRCVELAELLSVAAAGVGDVAVVSPDLPGLDRDALRQLAGQGVRTAALVGSGDDAGERAMRQLGVLTILRPEAEPALLAEQLQRLSGAGASVPGGEPVDPIVADLEALLARSPEPEEALGTSAEGATPSDPVAEPVRGRVTVVWGPTGAPGRTTLAVTLAALSAQSGTSTLLVDVDTWGASIAQVLALIDEAPGVAAAARACEQGTLDVVALSRIAPEVVPGLRVLTGLPRADRWPELRPGAIEEMLTVARSLVEHVVVDCGFALEDDEELSYDTAAPRRNGATLAALESADDLVVVGAADPIGLQRLVRAVQDVAVVPAPEPVVVVNKVRESVTGPGPAEAVAEVLSRFAGLDRVHLVPWAPQECDAALLEGRTLVEAAPRAAITTAVAEVLDRIRPGAASERRRDRRSARGRLFAR
jgi:Flp pilus assembly CpaE family ATPase